MDLSHDTKFLLESESGFKNHMHEFHSGQFDEAELDDLTDACHENRDHTPLTGCPFCHEDDLVELKFEDLIQHITHHRLTFARISLEGYFEEDHGHSDVSNPTTQTAKSSNQVLSGTITDELNTKFTQGGDDDYDSLNYLATLGGPPDTGEVNWGFCWGETQIQQDQYEADPVLVPFICRLILNDFLDDQQRRSHQALKMVNYKARKDINPRAVKGSGKWALKSDEYLRWSESSSNDLLWLLADAGSGKSVIARSIIDNFVDGFNSPVIICHFFFEDNDEQNNLRFLSLLGFNRRR